MSGPIRHRAESQQESIGKPSFEGGHRAREYIRRGIE